MKSKDFLFVVFSSLFISCGNTSVSPQPQEKIIKKILRNSSSGSSGSYVRAVDKTVDIAASMIPKNINKDEHYLICQTKVEELKKLAYDYKTVDSNGVVLNNISGFASKIWDSNQSTHSSTKVESLDQIVKNKNISTGGVHNSGGQPKGYVVNNPGAILFGKRDMNGVIDVIVNGESGANDPDNNYQFFIEDYLEWGGDLFFNKQRATLEDPKTTSDLLKGNEKLRQTLISGLDIQEEFWTSYVAMVKKKENKMACVEGICNFKPLLKNKNLSETQIKEIYFKSLTYNATSKLVKTIDTLSAKESSRVNEAGLKVKRCTSSYLSIDPKGEALTEVIKLVLDKNSKIFKIINSFMNSSSATPVSYGTSNYASSKKIISTLSMAKKGVWLLTNNMPHDNSISRSRQEKTLLKQRAQSLKELIVAHLDYQIEICKYLQKVDREVILERYLNL